MLICNYENDSLLEYICSFHPVHSKNGAIKYIKLLICTYVAIGNSDSYAPDCSIPQWGVIYILTEG